MIELAIITWAACGVAGHWMFCADFNRAVGHLPSGWLVMSLFSAVLGPTLLVEELVAARQRNRRARTTTTGEG
jgi:hypothetical protein